MNVAPELSIKIGVVRVKVNCGEYVLGNRPRTKRMTNLMYVSALCVLTITSIYGTLILCKMLTNDLTLTDTIYSLVSSRKEPLAALKQSLSVTTGERCHRRPFLVIGSLFLR